VHDGLINMNVVNFPVITLEELTAMVHSTFFWLTSFEPLSLLLHDGNYLRGRCPLAIVFIIFGFSFIYSWHLSARSFQVVDRTSNPCKIWAKFFHFVARRENCEIQIFFKAFC